LGVQFGKEDFEKEIATDEASKAYINEDSYLKDYLEKKGGKLKCGPLSYIQGNFAYRYSQT
jgi:hypothetical protein